MGNNAAVISGIAMESVRSVAEMVQVARERTGRPPKQEDLELVAWLDGEEVYTEVDFYNLSEESLKLLSRAPGATLELVDELRRMRLEFQQSPSVMAAGTERQQSTDASREEDESARR